MTDEKAYKILTAAFLYAIHRTGRQLNSSMLAFGRDNLPDGDTTYLINDAAMHLFGKKLFEGVATPH
jgi:hypothetical protein